MDLTIVLARFWGLILVISCFSLLFNKKLLPEILRDSKQEDFVLLSGFIALLIGALHVSIYNYWEISVRGILTLFGWAALLKGFVRMTMPDYSKQMIGVVGRNKILYNALLILLLVLGIYFLYIGYLS